MGFMDKAKKMAEQAQTKLDEAQKQFNSGQGAPQQPGSGPVVEYDDHGRPIPQQPAAAAPGAPESAPPPGSLDETAPMASAPPPPPAPEASVPPPTPPSPAPEQPAAENDEYAPPKLSSGDPLSG